MFLLFQKLAQRLSQDNAMMDANMKMDGEIFILLQKTYCDIYLYIYIYIFLASGSDEKEENVHEDSFGAIEKETSVSSICIQIKH